MNCVERIEAVFAGEFVDKVPFALKGWRIPQCEMERVLRNEGLCIIDSRAVYSSVSPNTETETLSFERMVRATRDGRSRHPRASSLP